MRRGFSVDLHPFKIFLGEVIKLYGLGFLPDVKVLPLHDLRFLLAYDLLRVLPGWAYALPDPLPLESEIDVPVISALVDRHTIHLLLLDCLTEYLQLF
jgi:hypothetical protein